MRPGSISFQSSIAVSTFPKAVTPGCESTDKNSIHWKHGGLLQMLLSTNCELKKINIIFFVKNTYYMHAILNIKGHQVSPLRINNALDHTDQD